LKNLPYLEDHKIGVNVVFPAAGYLEMLLFVAGELLRSQKKNINDYTVTISHFTVRSPLFLSATETAKLQILVDSTTDFSNMPVEVYEWKSSDNWKKHVTAVWTAL